MKRRGLLACALGAAATVVAYALFRAIAGLSSHDADPREIYWTAHASFNWRSLTSLLVGAFVSLIAANLREDHLERALLPSVVAATAAIAAQATLMP